MSKQRDSGSDRGRNLGQGLGNITDADRRDLAGSGDRAPTKDQRASKTSGEKGAQHGRRDAGDPPRAL